MIMSTTVILTVAVGGAARLVMDDVDDMYLTQGAEVPVAQQDKP